MHGIRAWWHADGQHGYDISAWWDVDNQRGTVTYPVILSPALGGEESAFVSREGKAKLQIFRPRKSVGLRDDMKVTHRPWGIRCLAR